MPTFRNKVRQCSDTVIRVFFKHKAEKLCQKMKTNVANACHGQNIPAQFQRHRRRAAYYLCRDRDYDEYLACFPFMQRVAGWENLQCVVGPAEVTYVSGAP
ncbi:hypothetical protein V1264_016335 [Littorina saxatilis]|uniref:Uncharacterized protein n=1 Tax=Littorina saxatilis TaxID=31220 RepID=A0AAN9BP15_9CAEN